MLHEHKREPVYVSREFFTASLVAKQTLPPWEGCSQSPKRHLTTRDKAVVLTTTAPVSQPAPAHPFQSLRKTSQAEETLLERASDHCTPHPRRRCLEIAGTPPTSFPAALCIGAHQLELRGSCLGFRNCLYFREAVSQPTRERKSETPPKGVDPSGRGKKGGPRLTSLPTHVTSF